MGNGAGTVTYEEQVRTAAQRMAQNGVTLYIVDSAALRPTSADASDSRPGRNAGSSEDYFGLAPSLWTMEAMAQTTGGRYLHQLNDMARLSVQLGNDLKGAYTLWFHTDPRPDGNWHALKVTCKRRSIALRYRQAYLAETGH